MTFNATVPRGLRSRLLCFSDVLKQSKCCKFENIEPFVRYFGRNMFSFVCTRSFDAYRLCRSSHFMEFHALIVSRRLIRFSCFTKIDIEQKQTHTLSLSCHTALMNARAITYNVLTVLAPLRNKTDCVTLLVSLRRKLTTTIRNKYFRLLRDPYRRYSNCHATCSLRRAPICTSTNSQRVDIKFRRLQGT